MESDEIRTVQFLPQLRNDDCSPRPVREHTEVAYVLLFGTELSNDLQKIARVFHDVITEECINS